MEATDKIAYNVLKRNFSILCIVDMDVRRVSHEATQKGLITAEEKRAVWHSVSRDGGSAGMGKMLGFIMENSRPDTFQLFLEVLAGHSDLRFWADCLKDEYLSAQLQAKPELQGGPKQAEAEGKVKRRSLHAEQAPQGAQYEQPVEAEVIRKFQESKGSSVDSVRAILASYRGDPRKIRDSSKQNMLHIACATMDINVVKMLVEEYRFETISQDIHGNTPLHLACLSQNVDIVSYLITFCNPNIRNSEGQTPLHIAGTKGPASLLNHLLLSGRADRDIMDNNGRTATAIIAGSHKLSWCLNRKLSSASLQTLPERKNSREDLHRKFSAGSSSGSPPPVDALSILTPPTSNGRRSERKDSRGVSPPPRDSRTDEHRGSRGPRPEDTQVSPRHASSGSASEHREMRGQLGNIPLSAVSDDVFAMELKEADDHKEPDVQLRDKSKMRSQCMESSVEVEEPCCMCCRPKFRRLPGLKKRRPLCSWDNALSFCGMFKVVSFLLLGLLLGVALIALLIYFLVEDDQQKLE